MAAPIAPRSHPLDGLWQAPTLIWVVLGGLGLATVLALAPGVTADRAVYFGLAAMAIEWIALLTLGSLYLLRHGLSHTRALRVAYLALALLVLNTWLVCALAWWLMGEAWSLTPGGWASLVARLTGIILVVGTLGLGAFQNHWRARQLAVRAKQAELEALQARIRPHFLFNTLNTGAALVHQRPGDAERLLVDLADLFRAALGGPREIPLADELALARRYLEIEALRFGDRLRVRWLLPDSLPDVAVPALSIQPLVENAIRHGVERVPGGGEVAVSVIDDGDGVVVTVTNPLPGPTGSAAVREGHHVGLRSSRARIEALTDGRGRLTTREVDGRYEATVRIPRHPST
ncbi:sensor histidine kinase [Lysobacter sp. A3-1-A15]|uniref:sensor histidine kinase n=1 Tax=Novilysobacter viscosus TaxID=3098602 RepID=UPI002EDACD57